MTPEDGRLVALSQTLLDAVVAGYAERRIALPERQYWTIGVPANDCEQVVVAWQQSYLGIPGDEAATPQSCHVPRSAVFLVQLARAFPSVNDRGRSPSASDIQSASQAVLQDAWVLIDILSNTDPLGLGTIVTAEVSEVSGGLAGVSVQTVLAVP